MISFLGLSHLSLCYSAAALQKGYKVNILDFKNEIQDYLNGKTKIYEPHLDNILHKYKKNFLISDDFKKLSASKIIFLAKDLKTDEQNRIKLLEIKKLLRKISHLANKKVLVVKSQVPVGFTRSLKWNKNLKFHYVETLIFGRAINRALFPERIIIGKDHENFKVPKVLMNFLKNFKCPIIEMKYEESELTKGFINTYLASQVITTNYLNEFSKLYKANWLKIKEALSLDKRIGEFAYLSPGLGLSGGNIERDLKSISDKRKNLGLNSSFTDTLLAQGNYFKEWVNKKVASINKKKFIIGILGYTYKINTLSTKNSPQSELLNSFKNKFLIYDQFYTHKTLSVKLKTILEVSNIVVIYHNYEELKKINFNEYKNINYVIDPYKILESNSISASKKYFSLT
jgi:UDPglucose 6-dehydrogenase